jgi:hypothetical protein
VSRGTRDLGESSEEQVDHVTVATLSLYDWYPEYCYGLEIESLTCALPSTMLLVCHLYSLCSRRHAVYVHVHLYMCLCMCMYIYMSPGIACSSRPSHENHTTFTSTFIISLYKYHSSTTLHNTAMGPIEKPGAYRRHCRNRRAYRSPHQAYLQSNVSSTPHSAAAFSEAHPAETQPTTTRLPRAWPQPPSASRTLEHPLPRLGVHAVRAPHLSYRRYLGHAVPCSTAPFGHGGLSRSLWERERERERERESGEEEG